MNPTLAANDSLNFIAIISTCLITTVGLIIVAWIQVKGNRKVDEIKSDTVTINNAVNHVDPGEAPLTKRFNDFRTVMNESIADVKEKAVETKDEFNLRFDAVEEKIDTFTNVVTGIMEMHVQTAKNVESIRESVDKRKNSFQDKKDEL